MRKAFPLAWIVMLLSFPCPASAEFNPAEYRPVTQAELVKDPEAHSGKKYRVEDVFQFCGSDFCVQFLKTNINTREYYCFAIGPLCLVRMYVKKDHPDVVLVQELKKGDNVVVYGTFDYLGSNYRYMVVDRVVKDKDR